MELPSKLLFKAVLMIMTLQATERDLQGRSELVSQTLSQLASSLNYTSKNWIFLKDDKLYFYMMLCLPFSPSAIDILINALLFKYQSNFRLFSMLINCCNEVLEIEDRYINKAPTKKEEMFSGVTSFLKKKMKDKLYRAKIVANKKYIDDVYNNLVPIKINVLKYCGKVWQLINSKPRTTMSDPLFDPVILSPFRALKNAVIFSNDQKIISTVTSLFQLFDSKVMLDIKMNEMIELENIIEKKLMEKDNQSFLNDLMLSKLDDTQTNINDSGEDIVPDWKPSDIKDIIEEFLCSSVIPDIKSNPALLSYFSQDPKHVRILYSFILKPDTYEVSMKMRSKYRNLEPFQIFDSSTEEHKQAEISMVDNGRKIGGKESNSSSSTKKSGFRLKDVKKIINSKKNLDDDSSSYCIYRAVRAYQTYLLITDSRNWTYLTKENPVFVDNFFEELINAFKVGLTWNTELIVKLIEFFIIRDPVTSLRRLFSLNILNFFLSMLDIDIVKNFYLAIIDPLDCYLGLNMRLRNTVWRHMKHNYIFDDLFSLMIEEKVGFFSDAEEIFRETIETRMLIDELETALPSTTEESQKKSIKFFDSNMMLNDDMYLTEEKQGSSKDIDRLEDIVDFGPGRSLYSSKIRTTKDQKVNIADRKKIFANQKKGTSSFFIKGSSSMIVEEQAPNNKSNELDIFKEPLSISPMKSKELFYFRENSKQYLPGLSQKSGIFGPPEESKSLPKANTSSSRQYEFIESMFSKLILQNFIIKKELIEKRKQEGLRRPKNKRLFVKTEAKPDDLIELSEPRSSLCPDFFTSYDNDDVKSLDGCLVTLEPYTLYPTTLNHEASLVQYEKMKVLFSGVGNMDAFLESEPRLLRTTELVHHLIKGAIITDSSRGHERLSKIDTFEFWNGLFGAGSVNFEKLLFTYIYRMAHTPIQKFSGSSAFFCGETVNMVMDSSLNNKNLFKFKHHFLTVFLKLLPLYNRSFLIIFERYRKITDARMIKVQKNEIRDPLGMQRLVLAETFMNFIRLIDSHTRSLFDDSETNVIIQILIVWMFERRYHSIYYNNMLSMFSSIMKNKLQSVLVLVLIKLNTIGIIYESFFTICVNGTVQTDLNISQLLAFIKDFVIKLNKYLEGCDKKTDNVYLSIGKMMTWRSLRDEVLAMKEEKVGLYIENQESPRKSTFKKRRQGTNIDSSIPLKLNILKKESSSNSSPNSSPSSKNTKSSKLDSKGSYSRIKGPLLKKKGSILQMGTMTPVARSSNFRITASQSSFKRTMETLRTLEENKLD